MPRCESVISAARACEKSQWEGVAELVARDFPAAGFFAGIGVATAGAEVFTAVVSRMAGAGAALPSRSG